MDKYRLEPETDAAQIVREIYQWKLEGMSLVTMAKRLESSNMPSPAEYKKSRSSTYDTGFQKNESAKWTSVAILRILSNRVYTSRLEQGKSQKPTTNRLHRVRKLKS